MQNVFLTGKHTDVRCAGVSTYPEGFSCFLGEAAQCYVVIKMFEVILDIFSDINSLLFTCEMVNKYMAESPPVIIIQTYLMFFFLLLILITQKKLNFDLLKPKEVVNSATNKSGHK